MNFLRELFHRKCDTKLYDAERRYERLEEFNGKLIERNAQLELENVQLQNEVAALRAIVMELRVYGTSDRGRTGYGVTAFIPDETIKRIRFDPEKQEQLKQKVIDALVDRALKGLLHITEGETYMMTFEKLGSAGPLVSQWHKGKKRPTVLRGPEQPKRLK